MIMNIEKKVKELLSDADIVVDGDRAWDIRVTNPKFYKRIIINGLDGFADAYVDNWWDCQALDELLYKALRARLPEKLKWNYPNIRHYLVETLFNRQKRAQALSNIKKHYDLGNSLYQNMLDSGMSYTCAYWKDAGTLDEAQETKLDLVCRKLDLKPGMKVLDVGCGWGSFLKYAAEKYGVEGVGITLSKEQVDLGNELCKGLPVDLRLEDYRNITGKFDRIVSLGIIEHIGPRNYRILMEKIHKALDDDGLCLFHTIGHLYPSPTLLQTEMTWIEKHIFPGGVLPTMGQICNSFEGLFMLQDVQNMGHYYYPTLLSWEKNFTKNWDNIKNEYDERFYRMWKYYLLSCSAALRSGRYAVWQLVLDKGNATEVYQSVR